MREIKFRAYQPFQSLDQGPGMYPVIEIVFYPEHGGGEVFFGDGVVSEFFEDIHLMQFTGLHDKNGKEIYEGDICKWKDMVHKIEWSDDDAGWSIIRSGGCYGGIATQPRMKKFEVIGNIYENPELLD